MEVSLPRNESPDLVRPPCVVDGGATAVTKTFQILYRNEEVRLENVAQFKVHAIVETGKVRK